MDKRRHNGISTFSAQITSTISVALVLMLLGIIALLGIAAKATTDNIRQNMGFDIILTENATDADANRIKQVLLHAGYVSSTKFISAQDAINKWQEDTGEDLIALLGVNPFSPEFEVRVKAQYADIDSISNIISQFERMPSVAEINVHTQIVESINNNIRNIAVILLIISAALLLISFVLINNTVRLTIYSRRFIIHTMKLVGATAAFIRRPFIINNIVHGIIAAVVAILLLSGLFFYIKSLDPAVIDIITYDSLIYVFVALIVAGIAICAIAALLATNKYLRLDYDDMFK
jgi:cell division transport system permease protein